MKTCHPILPSLAVIAAAASLAGCSSLTPEAQTKARIQEKAAAYQALNERQQGDIMGGAIERGNTTDMVYMALGRPQKIVTSSDGVKAMWVYKEYYVTNTGVTQSFNGPAGAHYAPSISGENSPFHGGNNDPAWQKPLGWHPDDGKPVPGTVGPSPGFVLEAPEIKAKVVYVFFVRGKVAEIKLDGDASDQRTAAANVPQTAMSKEPAFSRSAYGWVDPKP